MKIGKLTNQIDCSTRRGTGRFYRRQHARCLRRLDKRTIGSEDHPTTLPFNRFRGVVVVITATILKPGDKVRLNDEGIEVVSGFIKSRAELEKAMGILTVKDTLFVMVDDVENFQSIDIKEFPALLDNLMMEKVSLA